jgi:hypothetical protein
MGERENRSVTSKKANSVGTLLPDVSKFLHAINEIPYPKIGDSL